MQTFEGPLEALLNLIEARKLSISEVSLSEVVADAYLAYVEKLPQRCRSAETAQFILVASSLLLIKSRTLLPTLELSEDERESVEELERRLARYAIVRHAAKLLRKKRMGKCTTSFPSSKRLLDRQYFLRQRRRRAYCTMQRFRLLNALPKAEELAKVSVAPVLALEDAIANLRTRLSQAFKARFSEMTKTASRHEALSYTSWQCLSLCAPARQASHRKNYSKVTLQ